MARKRNDRGSRKTTPSIKTTADRAPSKMIRWYEFKESGSKIIEQEGLDVQEKYFESLNVQRDTSNGGYGATGVQLPNVGALYIRDYRFSVWNTHFACYSDVAHTTRYPTSNSWTYWVNAIYNFVSEWAKPRFDDAIYAALFNQGDFAQKIVAISVWNICAADFVYGRTLTSDLFDQARFQQLGVPLVDNNIEGMSVFMSQRTFDIGMAWIKEMTDNIQRKFPEIFGTIKLWKLAYEMTHRVTQTALPFEGLQVIHKRGRWVVTGFPNSCIRETDGTQNDVWRNGHIDMELLYEFIMSDLQDYDQVAPYLGDLKQFIEPCDYVALGSGMWRSVRLLERDRDENLASELYQPFRIIRASPGVDEVFYGYGDSSGAEYPTYLYWYGKDKPTWFAMMPIMWPKLLNTGNNNECLFYPDYLNGVDVTMPGDPIGDGSCWFNMTDYSGVDHFNVYVVTHRQIQQGVGANAYEYFDWANPADIMYYLPMPHALVGMIGAISGTGALGYLAFTAFVENFYVARSWNTSGEHLMRALKPRTWLEHQATGFVRYLRAEFQNLFGNFSKNKPVSPYGGEKRVQGNKSFHSSAKPTDIKSASAHSAPAISGTTDGAPVDKQKDSKWIPDDEWDKMSPKERAIAKKGGK